VFFDLIDTSDERFDRPIEWLLVALLAFAPLALGAVQRWSELVVYALCAAMALLLVLKLLTRPDVPFVWSWTYAPIGVVLGMTALQLVPLPVAVVKLVSPQTVALRTELAAPLGAAAGSMRHLPLSFYPEATAGNLRLLLVISAVYVVTLNVMRRAEQIWRLVAGIAIIGVAVAVIALLHLGLNAPSVYWLIGQTRAGWPVGPFINPNHLGQFLNLSLGAALAVLLVGFERVLREHRREAEPYEKVVSRVPLRLWALGAGAMVCAAAVVLTLSRGAILSMLIAAAVTAFVSRRRAASYLAWALVPVAWLVLLAVILTAFDPLIRRIDELGRAGAPPAQGRVQIVSDALQAWKQFPLLGTGLGTFEVVYPMYDRSATLLLATHAENEYVQMLMEGGAVGLAAVLVFGVMIAVKWGRCLKSAPSPMASAAVGLGFGLIAVAIHSLADFGQHVPANAALTAVTCATVVTLARASRQTSTEQKQAGLAAPPRAGWRVAGGAAVAAIVAGVLMQAWARARAESAWAPARKIETYLRQNQWQGRIDDYSELLVAATTAVRLSPDNVHYRHWLNYYRWKWISRERDPQTGQLVLELQELDWAGRIVQDLLDAVHQCPTYGPSYSLAGQIEMNVLDQPRGAELVRVGWKLSQADPGANFEAGLLDAREGNWEAAMTKLAHAGRIDVTGAYLKEAVQVVARDLGRPDMAITLAGENVPAVRAIIAALGAAGQPDAAAQAKQHLAALIQTLAARPDASQAVLLDAGRLAIEQRNFSVAVTQLRRALSNDYASAELHFELARALDGAGQSAEALDAARTAERLGSPQAKALVRQLLMRPTSDPSTAPAW
jgi:O-antigen ligase